MAREYDVVVFGATGFTGKLVAEYLLSQYGSDGTVRWAMAGRSLPKLEQVAEELGTQVPLITCDSNDSQSLDKLVQSTTVICTTVGPYALYGSSLVAACAKHGTHYCDLTGEVQWMQKMISAHQQSAESSGARIVHTCGFDSIPSDLGVYFLQQAMQQANGAPATHIKYRTAGFSGGFSGGTVYSMINMFDAAAKDPGLRKLLADPYSLNPPGSNRGSDVNDQTGAVYDEDLGRWTLPFVMAAINTRVVRRSNALLNDAYGTDFNYDEAVLAPKDQGALKSKLAAAAMGLGTLAIAFKPMRALIKGKLPAPGEGPSKQQREEGYFDIYLYGVHGEDRSKDMIAQVTGDKDPGYGSTSKMLAEAAVCLAKDELSCGGGIWTPAAAMGDKLIQRLIASAGLTFDIVDQVE